MFDFSEPFAVSIFCDDIRQEVGGKLSFMGVYYGAMYVPQFPIQLPKFCVNVTFYEPKTMAEARVEPVIIRVFMPNDADTTPSAEGVLQPGKEIISLLPPSELLDEPDVPQLAIANAMFLQAPVVIQLPGRIRVRCEYPGGQILKAGSLRVEHQPGQSRPSNPTLLEPPSEQSPPAAADSSSAPSPSRPARPTRRRRS
jgi:hypothetical protein